MRYADVILPLATPPMTFAVDEAMRPGLRTGMRVMVQLGARKFYAGIVSRLHDEPPAYKTIKPIVRIVDEREAATPEQLRLWEWISSYYMCPPGMVMRAALPAKLKLDGYSEDETLRSGYRAPLVPYIGLHPAVGSEEQLHVALDSLSRARTQHRAVVEYLARAGFLPGEEDDSRSPEASPAEQYPAGDLPDGEIPVGTPGKGGFAFGEAPLVPRAGLGVSSAVIRALVERGILRQVDLERQPGGEDSFAVEGAVIAPLPVLTDSQQQAYEAIRSGFAGKEVVLLHGVTGSGKTEIYIHLMAERLAAGGNVLYMLPEIALTAQLIERMRGYFGDRVVVYHSRLSDNRRAEVYRELLASQGGRLVVGVRSSVLLPLPHLSLVVVDEEHENSFKQADSAPRYQARDTAVVLAGLCGAKTLLGSATPSMESYYNALCGKYVLVALTERYSGVSLPQVLLSDTLRAARRGEKRSHFNKLLLDRIEEALVRGRQVMMFQNRRGFSPFVECGNCGWTASCPDCNVTLTYHKSDGSLRCHYCGYHTPLPPRCPSCGADDLQPRGFGTEKIEEALAEIFPDAVIDRLDADTSRTAHGYRRIISAFERGQTDILIGTQMITKGFDFGNVSLVGILNADNLLNYPDFRAGERAFQLMMQVGGRAGRRSEQGTVVIQTGQPSHPVLAQVCSGDYEAMARMQLAERQSFLYPPYCRLISLTLRHRDRTLLWEAANRFGDSLRRVFGRRLLGPEAPPVDRIRGQYLVRFLLKIEKQSSAAEAKRLLAGLFDTLHRDKAYRAVELIPDVDPQ